MPSVAHFRKPRVVNHTVDFYGEGVKFVYDANKLRDSWINEWAALEARSDGSKLNEMLNDLIIAWDITNDDGSAYPKTPEAMELFTIPDKTKIMRELMVALNPTSEEGNASSASSPAMAPVEAPSRPDSPTSPNGSANTESQTASESPSTS